MRFLIKQLNPHHYSDPNNTIIVFEEIIQIYDNYEDSITYLNYCSKKLEECSIQYEAAKNYWNVYKIERSKNLSLETSIFNRQYFKQNPPEKAILKFFQTELNYCTYLIDWFEDSRNLSSLKDYFSFKIEESEEDYSITAKPIFEELNQ